MSRVVVAMKCEGSRGIEKESVVHLFVEDDDKWDDNYRGCLVCECQTEKHDFFFSQSLCACKFIMRRALVCRTALSRPVVDAEQCTQTA